MRVSVNLPQFLAQQVLRLLRACRSANQSLPHQKSTNEFSVFFSQARYAHQRPWIEPIQGRWCSRRRSQLFRIVFAFINARRDGHTLAARREGMDQPRREHARLRIIVDEQDAGWLDDSVDICPPCSSVLGGQADRAAPPQHSYNGIVRRARYSSAMVMVMLRMKPPIVA